MGINKRNNREWKDTRRTGNPKPIATNNLVVCCGECTEINYFNAIADIIKTNYPNPDSINFDIIPDCVDPLKMAKNIENHYLQSINLGKPYHFIWVVFDKDEFKKDNFDNAVKLIEGLNNKYRDKAIEFYALWSNECIELWFLLHFNYFTSNIPRADYFEKLSIILKTKYEKNDDRIASALLMAGGDYKKAIRFAQKLEENNKGNTPSNSAPGTKVYEFFEKYKLFIK